MVTVVAFSYFRWNEEAARVIGGMVTNLFALSCSLLCFTKTGAVRGSRIYSFPLHSCVHTRPGRLYGRQEMRLRQHHQRPVLPLISTPALRKVSQLPLWLVALRLICLHAVRPSKNIHRMTCCLALPFQPAAGCKLEACSVLRSAVTAQKASEDSTGRAKGCARRRRHRAAGPNVTLHGPESWSLTNRTAQKSIDLDSIWVMGFSIAGRPGRARASLDCR